MIPIKLSLNNGSSSGVTIISNIFIDHYMPHANGEFVKIYLYLLRCLSSENRALDLSHVADVFGCTESDVIRTLRYWETRKLVVLSGTDELTSVDFLEPMTPEELAPAKEKPVLVSNKKDRKTKKSTPVSSSEATPVPQVSAEPESSQDTQLVPPSPDRLRQLKEMDEVRQIIFIAEQYIGTTLSNSALDELLFIYDTLHFSVDLIDYLIEYCVSKGSKSIHYIKKVALSWHESGIDSVSKAKQESTTFHRNYFTILRALGITNRNPLPSEVNIFNRWLNDYDFTLDIITEACARTIAQIGKANHRYTTKILNGWKEKGVRHLTDIQALDTLHRQLQADRTEQKPQRKPASSSGNSSNSFNNFSQRDYDYDALEKQLLNQ